MKKTNTYSPEVRERAVRMVIEHRNDYPSEWAAVESIAAKIGCAAATLHGWVRRQQTDAGAIPGPRASAVSVSGRRHRKASMPICTLCRRSLASW